MPRCRKARPSARNATHRKFESRCRNSVTPLAAADLEGTRASLPYLLSPSLTRIEWSQALPATALAGLIAAVLMMTPLAAFGLGMLIGGSLSVVFYRRRNPAADITPGMGSRLGMVSGVLGGCIFTVLLCAGTILFHAWDGIRDKIVELVEQTAARNPDPQAQQAMEFFKTQQGISLLVTSALVGTLVAFVIFSAPGRRCQRGSAPSKRTRIAKRRMFDLRPETLPRNWTSTAQGPLLSYRGV